MVDQGRELYGQACILCHGPEGQGIPDDGSGVYGPSLLGVGAASVDFMVRTGRMPAEDSSDPLVRRPPQFNDTERAALTAYVQSLTQAAIDDQEERLAQGEDIPEAELIEPGPPIPDIQGWQEADLSRGLELFTTNCAACHGPTAAGIAVGRDDVSSNLRDSEPIVVAEAVRVGPGVMPVFGDEVVTDEDLEAIVAWVDDVTHRDSAGGFAFGRGGPVSEGLIAWIVGLGVLGVVIYLLGEREGTEDVVETDGPEPTTGATDG
nr:c-type cytochrome [Salsipaludibacter albus]